MDELFGVPVTVEPGTAAEEYSNVLSLLMHKVGP